jgi:adenylate cyclase
MDSRDGPGQRPPHGRRNLGLVGFSEAATWFSNLSNFLRLSEQLSPAQLVDSLNTYFEAVVGAIYDNGGEVVLYIGDAILAAFPGAEVDRSRTCGAALAALDRSAERLIGVNAKRSDRGEAPFQHLVGLHFGRVHYANIGSREHVQFTGIGQDVNIACRLGSMCGQVGQPVLASATFASFSPTPMTDLGSFSLKGIAAPVSLYAPAG